MNDLNELGVQKAFTSGQEASAMSPRETMATLLASGTRRTTARVRLLPPETGAISITSVSREKTQMRITLAILFCKEKQKRKVDYEDSAYIITQRFKLAVH